MKRKLIFILLAFFTIVAARAQKEEFHVAQLRNPTYLKGPKLFLKPLSNNGKEDFIDVNAHLQQLFDKHTAQNEAKPNANQLTRGHLFVAAAVAEEADCVLSGSYILSKSSEVEEKDFFETNSNLTSPIPYSEWRQINKAEVQVLLNFTYPDGTSNTDTVHRLEIFENKKGKKYLSPDDLVQKCIDGFKYAYYYQFNFIEYDKKWLEFPSVKVKDKALKEAYKNSRSMIKDHDVRALGEMFKRIYETDPSDEAAICLGLCYELLGNYPEAEKYYEGRSDFHMKVRMKKNMELLHYLQQIGANITLAEL